MNKWIEAIKLDIIGQEDKQRLTREQKTNYSLYLAVACFAAAIGCLFIPYGPIGLGGLVVFGAIGGRKLQIYYHKRKQIE